MTQQEKQEKIAQLERTIEGARANPENFSNPVMAAMTQSMIDAWKEEIARLKNS